MHPLILFVNSLHIFYNINMKKAFIYNFILIFLLIATKTLGNILQIESLDYNDNNYNNLLKNCVASKNRMLKQERLNQYKTPTIYSYTLKAYEDIWTIIAKTSLNIDTIATLNRIDFIGMLKEGVTVYLPDTLGLFFETKSTNKDELAEKYKVKEDNILTIDDPIHTGEKLYFVPEVKLSFLERTFLTGVVFHAPLMGIETSKFGKRINPFVNEITFHGGVDIAAPEGKPVRAARHGKVVYAGKSDGYGNLVIIQHELGYYTFYGHLKEIKVEKGDLVETGQEIGTVGSTGRSTGPHLHFEIRRYNKKLNPDDIPFLLEHK